MNIFKKLFRSKEIWLGKTAKEMTTTDWEEYKQYQIDIIKISDKIPTNGQSIVFKSGNRYFRVKELGQILYFG